MIPRFILSLGAEIFFPLIAEDFTMIGAVNAAIDAVFTNFKKGNLANASELQTVFGTVDEMKAAKIIVDKGDAQGLNMVLDSIYGKQKDSVDIHTSEEVNHDFRNIIARIKAQ